MYDYGSPGKVFQLDEKSLEGYLDGMSQRRIFQFDKGAGGLSKFQKLKILNKIIINCYRKLLNGFI